MDKAEDYYLFNGDTGAPMRQDHYPPAPLAGEGIIEEETFEDHY